MAMRVRTVGDIIILEPQGELTTNNGAGELSKKVEDLIELGQDKIVINLDNIRYSDTGGIEALLAVYDEAAQSGGRVKFSSPKGEIRYLLSMTKLSMEFDVLPDDRKATASLAEEADITSAQFVMLSPFPGIVDFQNWEKTMESHPTRIAGFPLSRYWLIPQSLRPNVCGSHPTMSADEIRQRTQSTWDRF
jgi:anti-anti-sigma factor